MSDQAGLAVTGGFLVALGVALWFSFAVGLVVAGVEMLVGAYVAAYLHAQAQKVERR